MFRLIHDEEDSDNEGSKYSCDDIINTHPDNDGILRHKFESLERNKTHSSVLTNQNFFTKQTKS